MSSVGDIILAKINNVMKYTKNGIDYFSLNDLFQIKEYVKGFNNNKKRFLADKFKNKDDVIFGRIVMNNDIIIDKIYSPKYSKYFVKCDSVLSQFSNYIKNDKNMNIKEAPAIISNDICFFKDKDGIEHEVEMRGVRAKEGIYFKCKDLQRIFEMNSMCKNVLDISHSFVYNEDFLYFAVVNKKNIFKKKCFLTFSGLMKVFRNRNNVSKKSYLYLIKIKENVFKFGKTNNLKKRFQQHYKYFNTVFNYEIKLIKFIELFGERHSILESKLKQYSINKGILYKHDKCNYTELINIEYEELERIQNTYFNKEWVYSQINMSEDKIVAFKEHIDNIISKDRDGIVEFVVEMKTKYEKEIQILNHKIELKNKDIEMRDKEIKMLEREAILKDKLLQFYEEKNNN